MSARNVYCDAVIDEAGGWLYYLGFDLVLAAAPIRGGEVHMSESGGAVAPPDEPELAAWHAVVRAALLSRFPGFEAEREQELARAHDLASLASVPVPDVPDAAVRSVALSSGEPTPLAGL